MNQPTTNTFLHLKGRNDPTYLTYNAATGAIRGLIPSAITSLKNGFSQWKELDFTGRGKIKEQWFELLEELPEDLK